MKENSVIFPLTNPSERLDKGRSLAASESACRNPAHLRQICSRNRSGLIIKTAPADPQNLRLTADQQIFAPVDHRFAIGDSPAFPSAPDKKSRSSVNSPILA